MQDLQPTETVERRSQGPSSLNARNIIAVNVGNTLEWFDWTIYAVFAPFFAAQFFNTEDPASALLATLAVFGVGFLMRPVGGWLFGLIADRKGRRFSLMLAICMAALGSMVIAVAPTFESVGIFASLLLLLARLVQGLAHGGETGAAFTYLAEIAPPRRRAMWAATPWIGVATGSMLATGLGAILTSVYTQEEMMAFGWRIPFFAGAVVGLYAIYIRLRMTESEVFESQAKRELTDPHQDSYARRLWNQRKAVLILSGISMSGIVIFYTWFVFAPSYAISAHGMEPNAALIAGLLGQAVFLVATPLMGLLADRIGRRPVGMIFGIGFLVFAIPLELMLNSNPLSLFLTMSIASLLLAATCGVLGAVLTELVPTDVRATLVGISYAGAGAIFGGTAPYLNTWLSSIDMHMVFVLYMMLLALVTTIVFVRMPETKGVDISA
jgi:MFS transporter, MHS family, alpha-ketoglutarate permease